MPIDTGRDTRKEKINTTENPSMHDMLTYTQTNEKLKTTEGT